MWPHVRAFMQAWFANLWSFLSEADAVAFSSMQVWQRNFFAVAMNLMKETES